MKFIASALATFLFLGPSITIMAGEPLTIPSATYKAMKKGKKLNLIWQAPGFEGSKGFQLGKITNESEDDASSVLQDFPIVLARHVRAGSAYTLHLAVIAVRTVEKNNGFSSARVDVEGRVVDQGGTLVAAFETRGTATNGGNVRGSLRFAVDQITFGLAKDLFTAGLPGNETPSDVIVAAKPTNQESSVAVPAPGTAGESAETKLPAPVSSPLPVTPVATTQVLPSETNAPKVAAQPLPMAVMPPPMAPVQPPPQDTPPKPNLPAATTFPEALPSSITGNMKRGSALDRLWISPAYDKAGGFAIGEVRYWTDQRDETVTGYLPDALADISRKDAPCLLQLGVTGLTGRMMISRNGVIRMKVEGRLIAKDGTILAAFQTAESVQSTDDLSTSFRQLARKVVLAIGKDLR